MGRRIGAQLKLVGADVWFDEWEIRAGDSIAGSVNDALAAFDVFALLWSVHAARSEWVRAELEAALTRRLQDRSLTLIPVCLDETPLPALVAPYKYLKIDDGVPAVVDAIMGFSNDRDRLRAIQHVLDAAEIAFESVPGYGLMVACPRCGAPPSAIEGYTSIDYDRDDEYVTLSCKECGWVGGGEI